MEQSGKALHNMLRQTMGKKVAPTDVKRLFANSCFSFWEFIVPLDTRAFLAAG
jgi:hypothetical protein